MDKEHSVTRILLVRARPECQVHTHKHRCIAQEAIEEDRCAKGTKACICAAHIVDEKLRFWRSFESVDQCCQITHHASAVDIAAQLRDCRPGRACKNAAVSVRVVCIREKAGAPLDMEPVYECCLVHG